MNNTAEIRLRRAAVVLAGILVLQLLYAGGRLLFLSEPEPIAPSQSALEVGAVGFVSSAVDEQARDFVARPLFWPGREAYEPVQGSESPVAPVSQVSTLRDIKLLGVYSAGANSGIIVTQRGEQRRLKIDEKVDGWTFTMMSDDGAIFENGKESTLLRLEHALPGAAEAGKRRTSDRRVQAPVAERIRDNNLEQKGN